MKAMAIGIDIGGTNTPFAVVDREGKRHGAGRIKTTGHTTAEEFVQALASAIKEILNTLDFSYQLAGIGVGAPNGNFYEGTIENAPNLPWKGVIPLADLIRTHYEVPVIVTNDANAAAVGEMIYGAAKGMKDFFEVTLGTGLGSGFVANGELIYGHHSLGGELGHTIIEKNGRSCNCGRKGCFEQYASATGFMKTVFELLETGEKTSLTNESKESLNSEVVAKHAENGDQLALKAFDITADHLAFGIANAVGITNPEVVILFGGLANAGELLMEPTKKYLETYLHNLYSGRTKLLFSTLPDSDAAVLGASALVWNQKEQK